MKKLLVLLLALTVVFTLSACCLKHEWKDATCTEPKTCAKCGKTEGEPLGHTWEDATCTAPKTCTVCGATEGEALGHKAAAAASCTEDSVCSVCGEILEKATGHVWSDATCTEAKTCSVCGATEGEALGHKWDNPTCAEPKTCSVCGLTENGAAGHSWTEATCTAPKTCTVCGATEGEALGHSWKDATCTEPKTCTVCGATEGEALGHDWKDATCIEPMTCPVCGVTENEMLPHTWVEATCTAPKTCSDCGLTEGEALGHKWFDATCTAPKTCTVCGATEGEALGHKAAAPASCTEDSVCSVCGEVLEKAHGHKWVDATYTAPMTCSVCGLTEGEPLCPYSYTVEDGKVTITGYLTDIPAELEIPEMIDGMEVVAIGDSAFENKVGLVSITMPNSVVNVGANAFANSPDLTTVNMPSFKDAEFEPTAFDGCGELTGVMGDEVFYTGFTCNSGEMKGEWDGVRGTCFHGVYTDVYRLDEPIRKCVSFTLDTAITKYNGNPFREWDIYVKRGSKAWEHVAEYTMSKEKAGQTETFTFEFEKPISFDSIAVVDRNNFYHTVYYTVHLYDVVRYFSIDKK